jgi:lysine 2,3-aminomutase
MAKFKEKITPHLQNLINSGSDAVSRQFVASELKYEGKNKFVSCDPLSEDKFSPVKGIVHKYSNRVLWKVSYECAAHCQFCTRRRQVGNHEGELTKKEIDNCIEYILGHREIEEIILSGGDPFFSPKKLDYILKKIVKIDSIKIVRIGTRLPIHFPQAFDGKELKIVVNSLVKLSKKLPVYILIHINHPDELTRESRQVIEKLRRKGLMLMSQTVFLKNINDNFEILHKLFKEIYFLGVIPYYIFRCDYVTGLESFVCDIKKEQKIMTELTKKLSGIAVPTHIFDVPGKGKIPVPLDFWGDINLAKCKDFEDKEVLI